MHIKVAEWRKGIAATLAALGVVASSGLLHGTAQTIVTVTSAVIGAVAVVVFENERPAVNSSAKQVDGFAA